MYDLEILQEFGKKVKTESREVFKANPTFGSIIHLSNTRNLLIAHDTQSYFYKGKPLIRATINVQWYHLK